MLERSSVSLYPLDVVTIAREFGAPSIGFLGLLRKELRNRLGKKLQDTFLRV